MNLDNRPELAPHVYLQTDALAGEKLLIFPEELLMVNEEAAAILSRCDGRTPVADIIQALAVEYEAEPEELAQSVLQELKELHRRRLVTPNGIGRSPYRNALSASASSVTGGKYRPLVLLAELTYRCPLHCPYCSNPVRYPGRGNLRQRNGAVSSTKPLHSGILHLALSGGEPLLRADLARLTEEAARRRALSKPDYQRA